MYAVIKSGGQQHRVVEGEVLTIEKVDVPKGEVINFTDVLMIEDDGGEVQIGSPVLQGASVSAQVLNHGRDKKVKIIKFRRRKHSMKRQGHRQWFTQVKVTGINPSE